MTVKELLQVTNGTADIYFSSREGNVEPLLVCKKTTLGLGLKSLERSFNQYAYTRLENSFVINAKGNICLKVKDSTVYEKFILSQDCQDFYELLRAEVGYIKLGKSCIEIFLKDYIATVNSGTGKCGGCYGC